MPVLKNREIKVIKQVQGDIPLTKRPFETIGQKIGASGNDVIDILRGLKEKGLIRRFGAVLRHRSAGFSENAMVVWSVPEERCEEVGSLLASYREITHCYERTPPLEGIYNIFTMIHLSGGDPKEDPEKDRIEQFTGTLSSVIGIDTYRILRSLKEFKKSSMEYF